MRSFRGDLNVMGLCLILLLSTRVAMSDEVKTETLLMISTTQTADELGAFLNATRHYPHRRWVLRGLPPHLPLKAWLRNLKPLLEDSKAEQLPIDIDPVRFERYGITRVPALVQETETGTPIHQEAASLGIVTQVNTDPDQRILLREKIKASAQQPLSAMASRESQTTSLPETKEARIKSIDPTVVTPRTLKTRSGKVIAIEGMPVNPFLILPLKETLLLFDGDKPSHLVWASQHQHTQPSILIASTQGQHPNLSLAALGEKLKQRVFLLNETLISHLQLASLPARVEVDQGTLILHYDVPVAPQ